MTRLHWARGVIPLGLCAVVFTSAGFASAGVVAGTGIEPFPGAVYSGSAAFHPSGTFYLADRHITISWRVRTHAPGMALRLYRGDLDGNLVLLAERLTEPGVRSFRQEDVFGGHVPFFYLLKVVDPTGRETELASRFCSLLQMSPVRAAMSAPSPNAAVLTPSVNSFRLVMSGRPAQGRFPNHGLRPEPPTPPPRR
jgi:hypothetical protein